MILLGIETSCDDTGIAVLAKEAGKLSVRSNVVASQTEIHREYGGVYPTLAKRAHEHNLPPTLEQALQEAGNPKIDAVAVTYGPGLSPCLWSGITFAKELAEQWAVPLIPVDHIEGHLLIALLAQSNESFQFPISNFHAANIFPAIALIVSGGHTQLVLVETIGKYNIVGETRDDAAGEAFDKTARILGLPYPGGPAIAEHAQRWNEEILLSGKLSEAVWHGLRQTSEQTAESATPKRPLGRERGDSRKQYSKQQNIRLPRPMLHTKDYDFSFSGLKTAVLYDFQARSEEERTSPEYVAEMSWEIQEAIVEVLLAKTKKAADALGAKALILGGGVAANELLKERIKESFSDLALFIPPSGLATDNGVMTALTGYVAWERGDALPSGASLEAAPNLRLGEKSLGFRVSDL